MMRVLHPMMLVFAFPSETSICSHAAQQVTGLPCMDPSVYVLYILQHGKSPLPNILLTRWPIHSFI